jgi:hypothetical protein
MSLMVATMVATLVKTIARSAHVAQAGHEIP